MTRSQHGRGTAEMCASGTAATPVAGGGKVGALGHEARGAWRKGSGRGRRCSTCGGGSMAQGPVDGGRPRRAGPVWPRSGRRANAGVDAALERQGQNQFSLHALTGIFLQKFDL
jgi:hypothetical protein